MTRSFSVTWDYRCPFARNAHEHLVAGLAAGAEWDVRVVPFSLSQVHVEEGGLDVWDDPEKRSGLWAMEAGIVVRDRFPEQFPRAHMALFAARHEEGRDLREREVVHDVLAAAGVDADAVFDEIEEGWPLEAFRDEHERAVSEYGVFGVPTFIMGDQAVFVRLTDRPGEDRDLGRRQVDRLVDLLEGWPELNEYKHTRRRR